MRARSATHSGDLDSAAQDERNMFEDRLTQTMTQVRVAAELGIAFELEAESAAELLTVRVSNRPAPDRPS